MSEVKGQDRAGLPRRLLGIGSAAGRRAEAGGIRFTALLVATLVVAIGLGSLAAVHAAYEGKQVKREARTPVTPGRPAVGTPAEKSTLWLWGSDSLQGERRFSVVYLSPRTKDAPLPPGVVRWPGPGEAVLSPGLRKAGAAEGIDRRYGRLAGTIGQEGLEEPSEWLAYVRPPKDLAPKVPVETVVGFGPDASGRPAPGLEPGSSRDDDKSEWMFQALVIGMLLIPGIALLLVAARAGAQARDRRTALVAALGGRRTDRALIAVGEAYRPVLLGAIASGGLIAAAMLHDWRVPHTGFQLSSAYLRQYGPVTAVAPVAAAAVVLAVVILAGQLPGKSDKGTRPLGDRRSRWLPRLAPLCPLMILLAVRGPDLASPDSALRVLLSWIGIAGTVLTLPAAVATGTAALGRLLTRWARARGRAGTLVAGRRTSVHPGATARLVTGVTVALIVLMQAVAWQGLFGAQSDQAQATLDRIGRSALTVGTHGEVSATAMDSFVQRLPEGTRAVLLASSRDSVNGPVTLHGDCPALISLHVACPAAGHTRLDRLVEDPRLQELIKWTPHGVGATRLKVARIDSRTRFAARAAAGGENGSSLAVVRPDGDSLSVPALKQLSYEIFPRGAAVRAPGEGELTAGIPNRDQGRWSALFGVTGIGVLTLTAGLSGMAEFLRHGRALAPLSVLTGGYRVFRTSAAWSVLAPLALAGLAGTVVAAMLAAPVSSDGESYISGGLLIASAAVVVAVSLVMWLWSSSVAGTQARQWRPRGD
ncbi:ABC transporter permease [Streptomyces sp. NPDC086554]|uniref:ABC transporter permease n=1 Tax=Streptomyces sp. NPDC086554 TaxID=3154864 RepID=UPI0034281899